MRIGFVGLGKMGHQIVVKLIRSGHDLVVFDVNQEAINSAVAVGATSAISREDLVLQLGESPIVWLMIPSDYISAEIESFSKILPAGATLIDGGNTNYERTMQHAELLRQKGVELVDIGTSGGVMGLDNGFSLMVGGSESTYERISPALDALVQPNGAHAYMGPAGYGHFVKMVHNGIEYGTMQALAEGYHLLKEGPLPNIPLPRVSSVWQKGSIIESTLNKLVGEIMRQDSNLTGVNGYVADSGEGQWTLETAQKANIDMPALRDALLVRRASQQGQVSYATQLLAALRNKFGGHAINKQ
jgi:6-phosphogluconate dehydrogenase